MQIGKKTLLTALLISGSIVLSDAATAETWMDATGKFKIEAKFLGAKDGNVLLEKKDGSRIPVPFARLDTRSQALAKRLYAEMKSGAATPARSVASPPAAAPSAVSGSKFPADPTAEQTAEILTQALAESDLVTLWDSLPSQYQRDVDQMAQMAAKNVDQVLWNDVGGIVKKLGRLLTEKKEFIMANPSVAGLMPNDPNVNEIWDASANVINTIANSSLTNNAKMKRFTMANFLRTDGPKLKTALRALSELTQDTESGLKLPTGSPQIKVLSSDAQTAVVEVTQPDGNSKEEQIVKVDNRWVPEPMVRDWDQQMKSGREALQQLGSPEGREGMMQARMMLGMVGGPLDALLAANSQSEFDQALAPILAMGQGMMGGMMGGGMPGGPGGPGNAGPFGPGADAFGPPGGGADAGADAFGADAFGPAEIGGR